MADTEEAPPRSVMRTFDPSLILLLILAALAAVYSGPADAQSDAPEAREFLSEETGLRVVLPSVWKGARAIDETTLPGRATYRWEASDAPLAGAVLVVERVVGLNAFMGERWRRGQAASGYNGMAPTGNVSLDRLAFGPGVGLEIATDGRQGRVFFVQRGQVFWSVHMSAPASVLASVPPLLDALALGVRLSDKAATPAP